MLRNMNTEEHLCSGQSSSSSTGRRGSSAGLDSQESSWIGLLSRPALSLLQRLIPGRSTAPAPADRGPGWLSEELQGSLVKEDREFLRQLDDILPRPSTPHLTYLRCQHDGATGLLEPRAGGSVPWLTPGSLQELGLREEDMDMRLCQQTQGGNMSSVRTVLSQVLLSSQGIRPGKDWGTWASGAAKGWPWWGSMWGEEEAPGGGRLCPQPETETKRTAGPSAHVTVQDDNRGSTLVETSGAPQHKEEPSSPGGSLQIHRGSTPEPPSPGGSLQINRGSTPEPPHSSGDACSEASLLSPEQDNGYSSLEEGHLLRMKADTPQKTEEETPEESTSGQQEEEEEEEEAALLSTPQCQNKAIAFIMGCPCSEDESDSRSSDDEEDEDDDDGFDSEGSSDLSSSSDDDEDDDEDDEDSEAERLWSSLSQSLDPYNPRNFTARINTGSTRPRTIPTPTPPSSIQSTPASSPDVSSLTASPPPASSPPPSGSDTWDDSASASEVDEAESLRLWSSFSSSSDPYSPFNFQAPLRTRGPPPRTKTRAKRGPRPAPSSAPPPEYRKEEAEERLDSGFSEPCSSTQSSTQSSTKKVRFCDNVEEFFVSCGEEEEDRRGPWEELARDRCRFLRRCQEVEQSISYCLQPQHRLRVYQRLSVPLEDGGRTATVQGQVLSD